VSVRNTFSLCALALLAACAGTREPVHEAAQAPALSATSAETLFPAPRRGLAFALPPDTILDAAQLLDAFSTATGWTVLFPGDEKWAQWSTGVTVAAASRVPPASVYTFVEGVLVERRCVFSIVSATEPRMFALHWLDDPRASNPLARATLVDETELAMWREHPAQLVRVLLHVEHDQARELAHSGDNLLGSGPLEEVVVLGDTHAVLVEGLAPRVAAQCELIRAIDRDLARAPANTPR
jgi:hypothetical protein